MTEPATRDSLDDFTGDAVGGEILRRSLRTLAAEHAGTPLGEQVSAVLSGRSTMRDLAADPEFATLAHEGMRRYAEVWAGSSAEERAELVRQGAEAEAVVGSELPGSRP